MRIRRSFFDVIKFLFSLISDDKETQESMSISCGPPVLLYANNKSNLEVLCRVENPSHDTKLCYFTGSNDKTIAQKKFEMFGDNDNPASYYCDLVMPLADYSNSTPKYALPMLVKVELRHQGKSQGKGDTFSLNYPAVSVTSCPSNISVNNRHIDMGSEAELSCKILEFTGNSSKTHDHSQDRMCFEDYTTIGNFSDYRSTISDRFLESGCSGREFLLNASFDFDMRQIKMLYSLNVSALGVEHLQVMEISTYGEKAEWLKLDLSIGAKAGGNITLRFLVGHTKMDERLVECYYPGYKDCATTTTVQTPTTPNVSAVVPIGQEQDERKSDSNGDSTPLTIGITIVSGLVLAGIIIVIIVFTRRLTKQEVTRKIMDAPIHYRPNPDGVTEAFQNELYATSDNDQDNAETFQNELYGTDKGIDTGETFQNELYGTDKGIDTGETFQNELYGTNKGIDTGETFQNELYGTDKGIDTGETFQNELYGTDKGIDTGETFQNELYGTDKGKDTGETFQNEIYGTDKDIDTGETFQNELYGTDKDKDNGETFQNHLSGTSDKDEDIGDIYQNVQCAYSNDMDEIEHNDLHGTLDQDKDNGDIYQNVENSVSIDMDD